MLCGFGQRSGFERKSTVDVARSGGTEREQMREARSNIEIIMAQENSKGQITVEGQ